MRLHNFIENFKKHGFPERMISPEIFTMIERNYNQIVQFDFGDVTAIPGDEWKGLQDYSVELIKNNIFSFPFESVSFCYRADGIDNISIIHTFKNNRVDIYTFNIPIGSSVQQAFAACITIDDSGFNDSIGLIIHFMPLFIEHIGFSNQLNPAVNIYVFNTLSLNSLLFTKGVEQRITREPININKNRVRKGKLPIKEIREIFIRVGEKLVRPSGEIVKNHASPRMHWRRGHVRRLPSGEITNVRPHLVGFVDGAAKPSPKNYVVRKAG